MGGKYNSCEHDDCFTCPYPDCISSRDPKKRKAGRKRLDPEEKKRRIREAQKRFYYKHREKINEYQRQHYHKKKNKDK